MPRITKKVTKAEIEEKDLITRILRDNMQLEKEVKLLLEENAMLSHKIDMLIFSAMVGRYGEITASV